MERDYLSRQKFIDEENFSRRIPVCIVVDCSGSMKNEDGTGKSRIDRVNEGIELFYNEIRNDSKAKRAVEICLIAVGNEAYLIEDFSTVNNETPQLCWVNEKNNLTEGINLALNLLDERKSLYISKGIDYFSPWIIIMSDGGINREYSKQEFYYAQQCVREREALNKLSVFPIYVQEKPVWSEFHQRYYPFKPETYDYRYRLMSNFSNFTERLINIDLLDGNSFKDFFRFLRKSASSVANNNGIIFDEKYGSFSGISKKIKSSFNDFYQYKDLESDDISESNTDNLKNIIENNKNDYTNSSFNSSINSNTNELNETITNIDNKNFYLNKNDKDDDALFKKNEQILFNAMKKEEEQIKSINMLKNNIPIFPLKSYEDNNIILLIQIEENDNIVLLNNQKNIIFEKKFLSDGKYKFIINGNSVDVTKINNKEKTNIKENKIRSDYEKIEFLINSIKDWEKI